jgi:hypothetical protein
MNIIRSKDIIDGVPDVDSIRTIGASTGSRHATLWRTRRRICAPACPRRDIHKPSTVIKMKKIFA